MKQGLQYFHILNLNKYQNAAHGLLSWGFFLFCREAEVFASSCEQKAGAGIISKSVLQGSGRYAPCHQMVQGAVHLYVVL
jgi:hypothetical protein